MELQVYKLLRFEQGCARVFPVQACEQVLQVHKRLARKSRPDQFMCNLNASCLALG
jgi:hypothetical protein